VTVIVMLTREVESSQRKCGNYWKDGRYGDFDLKLLKQEGAEDIHKAEQVGGFYHFPKANEKPPSGIIERVFHLASRAHSHAPPRRITHLQYLEWSDMDVPESPDGLLNLIQRVNSAEFESTSTMQGKPGPILLHCSAGVGRTGGFILVDSLLAGVRREIQKRHASTFVEMEMEVDEPESVALQQLNLRPDYSSSRSSVLTPSSNSGSESALKSSGSSLPNSTSIRSPEIGEGSSKSTQFSRFVGMKPKKLSHLVVDKLAKESRPFSASQVAQWSQALPSAPSASSSPHFGDLTPSPDEGNPKGVVTDYKMPRKYDPLAGSPPLPSTMSEPVREVLDDMREQRMSLCQSLRQYVFVHRAIIEGALNLVDEAKAQRASSMQMRSPRTVDSSVSTTNETAWSSTSSISSSGNPSSPPAIRAMAGRLSSSEGLTSRSSSSPPPHPKQSTGKRSASAAEGKISRAFTKKKKHRNGDVATSLSSNPRSHQSPFRARW
jgi:protein tyrosine phosphatase